MGDVIQFKPTRTDSKRGQKTTDKNGKSKKQNKSETVGTIQTKRPVKQRRTQPASRDTVKLWQFSQEFDDLVKRAVIKDDLPADELAVIIAHRLGTLLSVQEKSHVLTEFCCKIIRRLNPPKDSDSTAS